MHRGHRYLASSSPHVSHLKEAESSSRSRAWQGSSCTWQRPSEGKPHCWWQPGRHAQRGAGHTARLRPCLLHSQLTRASLHLYFHTVHRYFSQDLRFAPPPERRIPCPLRVRSTTRGFGQRRTARAGTPRARSTADGRQLSAPPGGVGRRRPLLAGRNAAPLGPSAARRLSVHREIKPETGSPLCYTPRRARKADAAPGGHPPFPDPSRTQTKRAAARGTLDPHRGARAAASRFGGPAFPNPSGGAPRAGPQPAERPAGRVSTPRPRPHLCRAIFRPPAARCELSPPPCPAMAAPHRPHAPPDAAGSGRARQRRFLGGGAPWRHTALPPALRSRAVPPSPFQPRFPLLWLQVSNHKEQPWRKEMKGFCCFWRRGTVLPVCVPAPTYHAVCVAVAFLS